MFVNLFYVSADLITKIYTTNLMQSWRTISAKRTMLVGLLLDVFIASVIPWTPTMLPTRMSELFSIFNINCFRSSSFLVLRNKVYLNSTSVVAERVEVSKTAKLNSLKKMFGNHSDI